jgi:hypothetical protein
VNFLFSVAPRLWTTAMIASAMPAAIRPYSIAVAPDSSARKRRMVCVVLPEFQKRAGEDHNPQRAGSPIWNAGLRHLRVQRDDEAGGEMTPPPRASREF